MGLIEQEIREIRHMAKDVLSGNMTPEMASVQIGFFNQTAKRINQMIQIANLAAKDGKNGKSFQRMVSSNIIGTGEAIQVEGQPEEKVKCPEQGGKLIDRNACLDYSGEEWHIDECQKCDQFTVTRKYCLSSAAVV
jgi:hypothetical protein